VVVVVVVGPPFCPPPHPTANHSTAAPLHSAMTSLGDFIRPSLSRMARRISVEQLRAGLCYTPIHKRKTW